MDPESKKSAKLAVLGMIGDLLEKEIDKLNNGILEDGEIKKKRGLLIYPSTRPINRALSILQIRISPSHWKFPWSS